MTKQNSFLYLSEFLRGDHAVLREISQETARIFLAIRCFNQHFIATDGVIPTTMQPRYEWPFMLASEQFLNHSRIEDAVQSVIPRLSVSRIRIFSGECEWDPQSESVMSFTHRHQGNIEREVSAIPLVSVLEWWNRSLTEAAGDNHLDIASFVYAGQHRQN